MVLSYSNWSTLLAHYQTEKEGADRIENLEQLVSAATLFISEEGFGHEAPAFAWDLRRRQPRV